MKMLGSMNFHLCLLYCFVSFIPSLVPAFRFLPRNSPPFVLCHICCLVFYPLSYPLLLNLLSSVISSPLSYLLLFRVLSLVYDWTRREGNRTFNFSCQSHVGGAIFFCFCVVFRSPYNTLTSAQCCLLFSRKFESMMCLGGRLWQASQHASRHSALILWPLRPLFHGYNKVQVQLHMS